MEKYSKVYILSLLPDILRCRGYFCELSLCELNTSACLSMEQIKQLSSALSKDHAFLYQSDFGATIPKMSQTFGIYINRRLFFLITRSEIPGRMTLSACGQTPTGTGPLASNCLTCPTCLLPGKALALFFFWG